MLASQIIKTAEHKADVKNTDFIPYEQKMQILNDCYKQMYQECINCGEQFFLKRINLSDGQKLPNDFYTIQEVYTPQTLYKSIIPRMNGSNQFGYDIVNDKFVLHGYTDAVVVYNPKPIYLTFQGQSVPTKVKGDVVAYYKNKYLVKTENVLYIVDSENEEIGNIQLPTSDFTLEKTYIRDDYVVVVDSYQSYNIATYYDFEGNILETVDHCGVIQGVDDVFYGNSIEFQDTYEGFTINNFESVEMGKVIWKAESSILIENVIYSEYTNTAYMVSEEGKIYTATVTEPYAEEVNVSEINEIGKVVQSVDIGLVHYDEAEFIYYDLLGRPKVISDQGVTDIKKEGYKCIYGTNDYLAYKNGAWVHFSPIPDTEMSYPNNAYYTYLSALVAMEFIKRLEGNTDSINMQIEEERFYKTIKRDNSQYFTIKDVGGYFY